MIAPKDVYPGPDTLGTRDFADVSKVSEMGRLSRIIWAAQSNYKGLHRREAGC